MDERRWNDVDNYLGSQLLEDDPVLNRATETSQQSGLPAIAVSPLQGKFLYVLARLIGARQVLEIGTLGGYSAIWLGRALPAAPVGRLVTLEVNPMHADVAQVNIADAGLAEVVEVRSGRRSTFAQAGDRVRRRAPSTSLSSTPTSRTTPSTSPGR